MFGGIAFLVNGKMCVTIGDDHMMCRIDPLIHEDAIDKPGVTTVKMKGRDYIGWINVDESVLTSKKQLKYWINLAIAYNQQIR